MYKFTNGIIVFDETTKNNLIKAGHKLVKEEINHNENNINKTVELKDEVLDENSIDNGTVEEKPRRSKKSSK